VKIMCGCEQHRYDLPWQLRPWLGYVGAGTFALFVMLPLLAGMAGA
jgi:hypothetical protein